MKVSLSTGCLYLYPLKTVFAWAQELGCQGLELALCPEVLVRGVGLVKNLCARYQLPILSLHPPLLPFPGWQRPLQKLPTMLKISEELGSPMVILHAPRITNLAQPRAVEFLETLKAYSGKNYQGPEVVLETPGIFFPRDRSYFLHNPRQLAEFAQEQGFRLVLDTAHLGTTPLGLMESYRVCRHCLANVHFSDLTELPEPLDWPWLHSLLKHHQLPGEGTLPLDWLLRALQEDGYSGPLTLEVSPIALRFWRPALAKRKLQQGLAFVRGVLSGG